MSRSTNIQKVLNRILSHSCFSNEEAIGVYKELGIDDDTALSGALLDIEIRFSESVAECEMKLTLLDEECETVLFNESNKYARELLAIDCEIAAILDSRRVSAKKDLAPEELDDLYVLYENKIFQAKKDRQALVERFKSTKQMHTRAYQDKKRVIMTELRELKFQKEKERILVRRDYHERKRQIIDKWFSIINERVALKGGIQ